MMKFKLIFSPLYVFIFITQFYCLQAQTESQTPFVVWDKTLPDFSSEELVQLSDGSFILAGSTDRNLNPDKGQTLQGKSDFYLIKLDHEGNKIWDAGYGTDVIDYFRDMIELPNEDFLLLGGTIAYRNSNEGKLNLIKIDKNGDIIWQKHHEIPNYNGFGVDGVMLEDGSFICFVDLDLDYALLKLSPQGDIIWQKAITQYQDHRSPRSIHVQKDKSILLAGKAWLESDEKKGDFWLTKLDQEGNTIWEKTYGGNAEDHLKDMIVQADGNILLAGHSRSLASDTKTQNRYGDIDDFYGNHDFWLLKLDPEGNIIWDKIYGGDLTEFFNTIQVATNGDIYLGGSSNSDTSHDKSENARAGVTSDMWMIRLDADGNKIWDKTLGGKQGTDILYHMTLQGNGDILLVGKSSSDAGFEKSESKYSSGLWLVKLENTDENLNLKTIFVDAETDQEIKALQNNALINTGELTSQSFTIQIKAQSGDIGSVEFQLEGPMNIQKTESFAPYTLFGENSSTDFKGQNFPKGDYTLSITPYSRDKKQGIKGQTQEIFFTIGEEAPITLDRFVLVDADTEQDIQVLQEGDIIQLDQLPTQRLSIRAESTQAQDIGSVLMELSSDAFNHTQTENLAPFALFGGEPSTDYFGRDFSAGQYQIKTTAYSEKNLSGNIQGTAKLNFTLTELPIKDIILVDAMTGQNLGILLDGRTIDCNQTLSMHAEANSQTESVKFVLKRNNAEIINRIENFAPYTLLGEEISGDYIPFLASPGEYQLTIANYTADQASGELIATKTINFTVVESFKINDIVMLDASTDQEIEGVDLIKGRSQIEVPEGGLSIKVNTTSCIDRVNFEVLKRVNRDGFDFLPSQIYRNEYSAPYTLKGETSDGQLIPWYPDGEATYILNIKIYSAGKPVLAAQRVFDVVKAFDPDQNIVDENKLIVYPNPSTQDDIHVVLKNEINGLTQVIIRDKLGEIIKSQSTTQPESTLVTQDLAPGSYWIEVITQEGIYKEIFIKY